MCVGEEEVHHGSIHGFSEVYAVPADVVLRVGAHRVVVGIIRWKTEHRGQPPFITWVLHIGESVGGSIVIVRSCLVLLVVGAYCLHRAKSKKV